MSYKRLFISDIHLNSQSLYERELAWFRPAYHLDRLLLYLEREVLRRADTLDELIFLGDTFDTWLSPMEEAPPTYDEILRSNEVFVVLVRSIQQAGVKVVFTPGNHDYDLDHETLTSYFPGCVITASLGEPGVFHAEHGHELTFFNASEFDPHHGRPVGYFFGRLGESRLPDGHAPKAVWAYLKKGALGAIHQPHAMGHIIKTIFYDVSGLNPTDSFILEDHSEMRASDVIDYYETCTAHMSTLGRMWRMIQRPINLHGIAWHLSTIHDAPIIILGHCHHELFTRLGHRLYTNPGAWCQAYAHVVELTIDRLARTATTQLTEVHELGHPRVVRRHQMTLPDVG